MKNNVCRVVAIVADTKKQGDVLMLVLIEGGVGFKVKERVRKEQL